MKKNVKTKPVLFNENLEKQKAEARFFFLNCPHLNEKVVFSLRKERPCPCFS